MSYFHILFSVPFSLIFPIHQKQNQYSTVCFLNISLWLNDSVHTNTDPMYTAYAYLYIYKQRMINFVIPSFTRMRSYHTHYSYFHSTKRTWKSCTFIRSKSNS